VAVIEGGLVIEGSHERPHRVNVKVTTAQLLALNATPITIVSAPSTDRALIFDGALIRKPAGTAYAAIAAGDDLAIKYTDASGAQVAECEATGFLDQATAQIRYVRPHTAASGNSAITPVAGAALVLHMLTSEVTTGTSDLHLQIEYRLVDITPPVE